MTQILQYNWLIRDWVDEQEHPNSKWRWDWDPPSWAKKIAGRLDYCIAVYTGLPKAAIAQTIQNAAARVFNKN